MVDLQWTVSTLAYLLVMASALAGAHQAFKRDAVGAGILHCIGAACLTLAYSVFV